MTLDWLPIDSLWRGALAVIPMALLVAAVSRLVPCRPSTRHALWLVVLILLVSAPFVPREAADRAAGWLAPGRPGPAIAARPDHGITGEAVVPPVAPQGPALAPVAGTAVVPPGRTAPIRADRPAAGEAPEPHGIVPSRPPAPALQVEIQRPGLPGHVAAEDGPDLPRVRPAAMPLPPGGKPGGAAGDRAGGTAGEARDGPAARADWVRSAQAAHDAVAAASPPSAPASAAAQWWRAWHHQSLELRDAVMGLPPVPPAVWAGGLALLLAGALLRALRWMRLLRRASPAPETVTAMVAQTGRTLGLRRVPATFMLDEPVPPFVFFGTARASLVLPRRLWARLDEVGRRAVICHELAHLKRGDHWVCWAQMVVGWVYWWHPVVWWVRRQLREEADLCCDAWVTALLPCGRRAYAQALLDARRLSSVSFRHRVALPSVGLGASSFRARRFARRITMIMTSQAGPRISLRGLALVGAMAAGGALVAPVWACPPSEKDKAAKAEKAQKEAALRMVVPAAPAVPARPRAPEAGPGTTYEQFMQDRGQGGDGSLEERIERLERQIERLHEQLLRLHEHRGGGASAPAPPAPPGLGPGGPAPVPWGPVAMGQWKGCLKGAVLQPGPTVARSYEIPRGKLEALAALLSREDVPIRVSVGDNSIEVHATEAQQCVFEAFCSMINSRDTARKYRLPKGKLEALNQLMVRDDVPILVGAGEEEIEVHGTDLEQAVFDACVTMINPEGAAARAAAEAEAHAHAAQATADRARAYEAKAAAEVSALQSLRAALRDHERQGEGLRRQADRLRERAGVMREKAESILEKAENAEEEAEELEEQAAEAAQEGLASDKARQHHESLLAKAQRIRDHAAVTRSQGQAIEVQADALERQADQLETQADQVELQTGAIEDQIAQLEESDDDG